jgi:hypothetical protein
VTIHAGEKATEDLEVRYCGTGAAVIQTDEQMLLAQQNIANLRRILLAARKVHSRQDYARMSEPILLEVQQRGQEILEYLSGDLEQPVASWPAVGRTLPKILSPARKDGTLI